MILWFIPLLYVVLHFWTSNHLVMEWAQAAPGTCSGWVTQPMWLCDVADQLYECEITSGTRQVCSSVTGWGYGGENPEELENLLKKKINLGPLAANTEPEKTCTRNRSLNKP